MSDAFAEKEKNRNNLPRKLVECEIIPAIKLTITGVPLGVLS